MPRPISWLRRLPEIRRSVTNSIRSHYERRDIEHLFQLQPRAAQQLMRAIAISARVGRSNLVERATLETFLEQLAEHENPSAILADRKQESAPAPRRKLRDLIQVDDIPATLESLPANLYLKTGTLTIEFARMEDLAGALYALAQVLENQLEEFAARYVPQQIVAEDPDAAEIRKLLCDLAKTETGPGQ